MLKKSVKNNSLKFLILITILFTGCFSLMFKSSVYGLSEIDDEVVTTVHSSLQDKVSLVLALVNHDAKISLLASQPATDKHKISDLIHNFNSDYLVIEDWEDLDSQTAVKGQYDTSGSDTWTKTTTVLIASKCFSFALAKIKTDCPGSIGLLTLLQGLVTDNVITNAATTVWYSAAS